MDSGMGIDFWGDVRRTDRDIGIDLWGDVHRMDSGIGIDLRGDANRTGHDIGIIKDAHRHLHNPNILASTLQIIKNHNYGKPLFFYLVQLTGGSHPSGGHLLVLDGGHHLARGILLLNGDYLLKLGLEPHIGGIRVPGVGMVGPLLFFQLSLRSSSANIVNS